MMCLMHLHALDIDVLCRRASETRESISARCPKQMARVSTDVHRAKPIARTLERPFPPRKACRVSIAGVSLVLHRNSLLGGIDESERSLP